jgi:hypothetical protein
MDERMREETGRAQKRYNGLTEEFEVKMRDERTSRKKRRALNRFQNAKWYCLIITSYEYENEYVFANKNDGIIMYNFLTGEKCLVKFDDIYFLKNPSKA